MNYSTQQRLLALIRPAATLLCTGLTFLNVTVDENFIAAILWGIAALVAFARTWWCNNNLSSAAIVAQRYYEKMKDYTFTETGDKDDC